MALKRAAWRVSLLSFVAAALMLALPITASWGFKRPTVAQVQPHAFGSCAALVGYAKSHYASTHGLPGAADGGNRDDDFRSSGAHRRREGLDRHGRAGGGLGRGERGGDDVLDDQQPGGRGRRARHREDRRLDDLHARAGQARGRLGHRRVPQARRDARPRYRRRECAAAALRQPRARRLDPVDDLRRAAADRRVAPRLALLGLRLADGDHRGRRARPLGDGGHADDVRRRPVRRRPPERLERPDRHLARRRTRSSSRSSQGRHRAGSRRGGSRTSAAAATSRVRSRRAGRSAGPCSSPGSGW